MFITYWSVNVEVRRPNDPEYQTNCTFQHHTHFHVQMVLWRTVPLTTYAAVAP